jgi:hypothetical protein
MTKSEIINFPRKPVTAFRTLITLLIIPLIILALAVSMIGGIILAVPYATLMSMKHVLDRYFEGGT